MRKATFRVLMASYVTIAVVIWLLPFFPANLDTQHRDLLSWDGFDALIAPNYGSFWAWLFAWIATCVGLWFFWPPAKPVFILLTIASVVLSPLFGTRVVLALDGLLGSIFSLLNGILIAAVLWPPLSNEFRRKPKDTVG